MIPSGREGLSFINAFIGQSTYTSSIHSIRHAPQFPGTYYRPYILFD